MAIEEHGNERLKYLFELLDEMEYYPAGLQKAFLNYNVNYDDEQEMFSREVIQMYRSGATDPRLMLSKLAKQAEEKEAVSYTHLRAHET